VKTSWRKIVSFNNFVNGFTADNGQQFPGWLALHPEESKLSWAIRRVTDQIGKMNTAMQRKFEDLDLDHCTTVHARPGDSDSPMVIARDAAGKLCFTVQATKDRRKAFDALIDAEDVEIEPYYATELPVLKDAEREIFSGFVISPDLVAVPDREVDEDGVREDQIAAA
jgi:hypothetical protein